jgi:hypothetical protein
VRGNLRVAGLWIMHEYGIKRGGKTLVEAVAFSSKTHFSLFTVHHIPCTGSLARAISDQEF